jgi:hypothetical protein
MRAVLTKPYLLGSYGTQSWMCRLKLVARHGSCATRILPVVRTLANSLGNHLIGNKKIQPESLGTIGLSNLCTETVQYSSPPADETPVCNRASIAFPSFI